MPTLTILTGGPARVTVRADDGTWCRPAGAVRDRTASDSPEVLGMDRPGDGSAVRPGYVEHALVDGTAEVVVPRGGCTVVVERGPEHRRVERRVDVGPAGARVTAVPERWSDLAAEGWWSGDLHVHRPLADAAAILRAEDLHLGAFVTAWTGRETASPRREERAQVHDQRPRAALTVDGDRHAVAPVTEDERGGGAWLLHGVEVADLPPTEAWWSPPGRGIVDRARAQGAWFDCEKLTWWETPVMVATGAPDSVGVLSNHYLPGGVVANEAWGRPRDRSVWPGTAGAWRYQLHLYYRYLSCGLRLPASAGSASGALPAPPGYDRVYVQAPGPFTVDAFYAGLRAGRSVVTNGPLLTLLVDDAGPGGTVAARRTPVRVVARGATPVDGVELVVDGRVVAGGRGPLLETTLDLRRAGWVAARAFSPDPVTVRLAHTGPVHVAGPGSPDAATHRGFFARWVADLTSAARSDRHRFPTPAAREETLDLYHRAARYWA
ncbi:CehA/McbA family metallohydrolase [Cellulomonas sp. C5510]|uniref:CehA/McbA family metallohydrolase n=1 Tax=Cellulomonas sp. C5510 TaxID=2871170 RepID=UPI001C9446C4|nr:CehA/McbA family metallohydrolase [Cellulomonas sp. C5510]QZN86827.1 CehA/McbA family metallohydrolase [Cellulomonas sp. C5510]